MPRPRRSARRARRRQRPERPEPRYLAPEEPLRSPVPRLAWRYRSELAPLYAGVVLLAAGLVLHTWWPGWWPVVAAAGLAAAMIVGILGYRVGLDREAEQAYAAGATAVATLWLAAATWYGPLAWPLPLVWLVGALAGGVPWWAHRRRRAKVRVTRAAARWGDSAERAGLTGSRLQRVEVDPTGRSWTARLLLRPGDTIDTVQGKLAALASALDLRPGALEVDPDPTLARRVILRVAERNPHTRPADWPGPPPDASITRPALIARFQDGAPAALPLLGTHTLIAGANGSGKSNVVNETVGYLAACPDAVLWGCDLKHGLELGPWQPVLDRVAATVEQAERLLAAAVRVMQARGEHLAERSRAEGRPIRDWPVSPETPALVVVVDEHARLAASKPAIQAVEQLTEQGRALAVSVISATQYPTVQALGSNRIAPQMINRVGLRVGSVTEVNVIFGPGAASAGWEAHKLPKDQPGTLYLDAPGADTPRLARSFRVTTDQVDRLATRYATRRPALDPLSAAAADGTLPAGSAVPDGPGPGGPVPAGAGTVGERPAPASDPGAGPAEVLAAVLAAAGPEGARIGDLLAVMAAQTGMQRSAVYELLGDLEAAGRVEHAARGRWRATPTHQDTTPTEADQEDTTG